jgi:hypothetical protein
MAATIVLAIIIALIAVKILAARRNRQRNIITCEWLRSRLELENIRNGVAVRVGTIPLTIEGAMQQICLAAPRCRKLDAAYRRIGGAIWPETLEETLGACVAKARAKKQGWSP